MKRLAALLSVFSIILAGCQANDRSFNINLSDFTIAPSEFSLQAGTTVTLNIRNEGTIDHEFNIMKFGIHVAAISTQEDREGILWTVNLKPGEEKSVALNVPIQTGAYQIVCAMPGHLQAGMTGTLTVIP